MDRFAVSITLKNNGLSQYGDFNFNSFCEFNGKLIAAKEEGIFELFNEHTDNGNQIDAFFEFPTTDFGMMHPKRFRSAYISMESNGVMLLKCVSNEARQHTYMIKPQYRENEQHTTKVNLSREVKGNFFMFRVENKDGCDFSIDEIQLIPVVLSKSRF